MDISTVTKLMCILEGYKTEVYKCTEGYNTIGFGFNMDQENAERVWRDLGCNESFVEVRNGLESISYTTAKILLEDFWYNCEIKASDRCNQLGVEYDKLPEWHRFILCDIVYNTGSISGWTKVVTATEPKEVLVQARRRQRDLDSRIAKIGYYYKLIDSLDEAHKIGLTEARYLV